MKKSTSFFLIAVLSLLTHLTARSQTPSNCSTEPPIQGANLGTPDGYTTMVANNTTTITLSGTRVQPSTSGTYTVFIKYTNGNPTPTDCSEYMINNATISVSGTTVTISLPAGQTIAPAILGCNTFKNWLRIRQTGATDWQYFLDYSNCSNTSVLPLTLISFTATKEVQNNLNQTNLAWTTASESNTCSFNIQRSTDGYTFNQIGKIRAAGFSSSNLNYAFTDFYPPAQSHVYYRLHMVDLDGRATYSEIRYINTTCPNGVNCVRTSTYCNFSISGPSTLACGETGSYSLSPSVSGISWSVSSNASISSSSCGDNRIELTRTGSGNITLTAQKSGCSAITRIITSPTYSISGPSTFCTSTSYSIPNLPAGATVNWSVSSSSIASLSNTGGSQVTVNKVYAGVFDLTATITICGSTTTIAKNGITAGVPLVGNLYAASGQDLQLKSSAEGSNLIWEDSWVYWGLSGTVASQYSISGGNPSTPWTASDYFPNVTFYMSPSTYLTFDVATSNGGCQETLHYTFVAIQNPNAYSYYSVAPNPASSDLTIYVDDEKLKKQKIEKSSDQNIQQILIVDKFGNTLLQQKYPVDTKKISLNVAGLSADIYVAKIFNGKNWTTIKFMKK